MEDGESHYAYHLMDTASNQTMDPETFQQMVIVL